MNGEDRQPGGALPSPVNQPDSQGSSPKPREPVRQPGGALPSPVNQPDSQGELSRAP